MVPPLQKVSGICFPLSKRHPDSVFPSPKGIRILFSPLQKVSGICFPHFKRYPESVFPSPKASGFCFPPSKRYPELVFSAAHNGLVCVGGGGGDKTFKLETNGRQNLTLNLKLKLLPEFKWVFRRGSLTLQVSYKQNVKFWKQFNGRKKSGFYTSIF